MNGAPLTDVHGAPARLLVPGRYGVKNLKWITEIAFLDHVHDGFWEVRGWSHLAPIRPNGAILVPGGRDPVRGPVDVRGVAYAGADPVTRVEITTDEGRTWAEATLDYAPGANRWVVWRFVFDPPASGRWRLTCRVHTASGATSDDAGADIADTGVFTGFQGCSTLVLDVV